MRTSYTTKLPYLILGFLFFVAFTPAPSPARGSCRIKNISLKKQGNFTQVSIYADKQFEFSHFTEEAKGGKPYRVVIDCKNAIFDLPRKNYKTGLPPGSITGIRTGQFQAVPEQIVRVVLDLKGPVVYKVVDPETENEASIAILTTQDPDFPMWVAVLGEKKDQKVSLEKKQSKILPTEIASKEEQRSDQSKASLVGAVGSTDLTASEKGEAKIVQKERVYRRTVCYADTGESIMSLKEKPVLLSQIKSEHEDIKKEELAKEEAEPSQKRRSLRETLSYVDTGETILPVEEEPVLLSEVQSDIEEIKIEERVSQVIEPLPVLPTPEFSWEVYSERTQSSSPQEEIKRIEEDQSQKDVLSAHVEPVLEPKSQTRAEEKKTPSVPLSSSKQTWPKRSSPMKQISRSPVPLGPFPEEQSSLAERAEKEKMARVEAERKEDVSTHAPGSIQKGIGTILGPEPAVARETEPMVDNSMIIQSRQESEMALVPQRRMVYYNPGTKRDIFLPLTKREEINFGETPQPLFENLRLVGILKDEKGNRALLEDVEGFGYILMSGDRIKNGYVITVEDNRAIFHIEEYGGYQIVVLELNREY